MRFNSNVTQQELFDRFIYDPSTGQFSSKSISVDRQIGSISKFGYRRIMLKGQWYYCHRLAWLYIHGVWPEYIDHINGNRSDNRLINLRNVTSSENNLNRSNIRPKYHSTTNYKQNAKSTEELSKIVAKKLKEAARVAEYKKRKKQALLDSEKHQGHNSKVLPKVDYSKLTPKAPVEKAPRDILNIQKLPVKYPIQTIEPWLSP